MGGVNLVHVGRRCACVAMGWGRVQAALQQQLHRIRINGRPLPYYLTVAYKRYHLLRYHLPKRWTILMYGQAAVPNETVKVPLMVLLPSPHRHRQ